MESAIKQLAEIYNKDNKVVKFRILKPTVTKCDNGDSMVECGICYKRITHKTKVMCSEPCNKVFHSACIERMIDQVEQNTGELNEYDYRCCYCRRVFDIHQYDLDILIQRLIYSKERGCAIGDSIQSATLNSFLCRDSDDAEPIDYSIYTPMPRIYKKPYKNQSKRAEFKQIKRARTKRIKL